MLVVREILGRLDEPRFAGRRVERLAVLCTDAAKPRRRGSTDAGTDVALDLPRGSWLADGAVLDDDGERVIAVERPLEEALVVRFDDRLADAELLADAVRVGHAFGNQHVPLEIDGREVRVVLTTSPEIARATVQALRLDGVTTAIERVALGRWAPLAGPPPHAHGHGPEHSHDHHGAAAHRHR
jgi:urease accessory protein